MSKVKGAVAEKTEITVEEKLKALFKLQKYHSAIDKIKTVRGELPLEVNDLEDEIAGLQTRLTNMENEINELEAGIAEKTNTKKDALAAIKKYESQQDKVRNNREFDSLTKEMEFQKLEIELADKRVKEYKFAITQKKEIIEASQAVFEERQNDLNHKKSELNDIISETQKEEEDLLKKAKEAEKHIEGRLLNAYTRIRSNVRNGLAVVNVERDACGGCFNKIPPQTQMDIRTHKKIIVCEHCGRVLVDAEILTGEIAE